MRALDVQLTTEELAAIDGILERIKATGARRVLSQTIRQIVWINESLLVTAITQVQRSEKIPGSITM